MDGGRQICDGPTPRTPPPSHCFVKTWLPAAFRNPEAKFEEKKREFEKKKGEFDDKVEKSKWGSYVYQKANFGRYEPWDESIQRTDIL